MSDTESEFERDTQGAIELNAVLTQGDDQRMHASV